MAIKKIYFLNFIFLFFVEFRALLRGPKNPCYTVSMKIDNIDINKTLEEAKAQLDKEKDISPDFKSLLKILFVIIDLLINRLTLNSKNSSKPPVADPNRLKKPKGKSDKNCGGQEGHDGSNLKPVAKPDEIINLPIDKKNLPKGRYHEVGYDARQVIHLRISRHVIEYRAQILENEKGNQWVSTFPEFVTRPVQYGQDIKAHSVYLSQWQLLPYNRIEDYFHNEVNIFISKGTLFRFNQEAYRLLENFDAWIKQKLTQSTILHVDETGINVNGKLKWLHVAANGQWTHFYPHNNRGNEATDEIGILTNFKGTLCHDHWKPYFIYQCLHSLCNAHHLRELERAFEQDKQSWAKLMKEILLEMNTIMQEAGGKVSEKILENYCKRYREILENGKKECPLPTPELLPNGKIKKRFKKSKARNLLERLINFEKETLRFMEEIDIPFTNNLAENNIRMTKVQRKISGCFRSMDGARYFCRIRSYISTCRKNYVSATDALQMLFEGKTPEFMLDSDWEKLTTLEGAE